MIQTVAEKITTWDIRLTSKIFGWNGKFYVDRIMYLFTKSGDGYLYIPFGIVLFFFDTVVAAVIVSAGVVAFGIELPAQKLLKKKIKRSRPFETITGIHHLVTPPDKFSFPSGHTAGAFIVAVLTSSMYAASLPIMIFWATGVGISRVYNGVHYPTDVIAGALLGICSAYAGLIIVQAIAL